MSDRCPLPVQHCVTSSVRPLLTPTVCICALLSTPCPRTDDPRKVPDEEGFDRGGRYLWAPARPWAAPPRLRRHGDQRLEQPRDPFRQAQHHPVHPPQRFG